MSEEAPKLIWEIDSTHPLKADVIRQALRQILDPELGMSIIELGLVRGVSMDDDQLEVMMILTTPFCPYGPAMVEQVRQAVIDVAGGEVSVEIGTELWDPSMMEEGAGGDWGLF